MSKFWLTLSVSFIFLGLTLLGGGLYADLNPVAECTEYIGEDGETIEMGIWPCTKIKDSKCITAISCKGFHETEGCKAAADGTISGKCFECDGNATGDFCTATPNSTCVLSEGPFGLVLVNCGLASGADCIASNTSPFGAKCSRDLGNSVPPGNCQGLKQCQ